MTVSIIYLLEKIQIKEHYIYTLFLLIETFESDSQCASIHNLSKSVGVRNRHKTSVPLRKSIQERGYDHSHKPHKPLESLLVLRHPAAVPGSLYPPHSICDREFIVDRILQWSRVGFRNRVRAILIINSALHLVIVQNIGRRQLCVFEHLLMIQNKNGKAPKLTAALSSAVEENRISNNNFPVISRIVPDWLRYRHFPGIPRVFSFLPAIRFLKQIYIDFFTFWINVLIHNSVRRKADAYNSGIVPLRIHFSRQLRKIRNLSVILTYQMAP